jgi:hypothetical protein
MRSGFGSGRTGNNQDMRIGVRAPIGQCDGFAAVTEAGPIGRVEEIWLDRDEEPIALAVRLRDGRRGLLLSDQVEDVTVEERMLTVRADARLLELEPPHLSDGAGLTASWTTTGGSIPLPCERPPEAAAHPSVERPLWRTIAVLYGVLTLIVLGVIALDVAIALLVTGSAHF